MRYRNIKIDYDGLRNILAQLDTYKRAVMQMIESMQAINQMLISSNDAVSILSLEDLYQNTKRSLLDCYNEIEALYRLLNDYVETMSALVDAKPGMTQVSRNDIYWNLQSMYKTIDDINSVEISNRLRSESGIGKTEEQKQAMKRNYQKIVNDIWCVCFPTVHTNILNCKNTLERYYTEKIVEYEETDDDYREKAMIFRGTYSGVIESGLQIYADIEQVKWDLLSGALGTVIGLLESIIYLTDITYTDGTELIAMIIALTSSDPPLWAQELIKNEQDPYKLLGALLSDPLEVLESMLQGANDAYDENGLVYYIGATVADILLGKAIAGALKGVKGASAMDEVAGMAGKGGSKVNYNILNLLSADDVNLIFKETMGYELPYKPGTIVTEIQLTENATYVRVYDKVNSRMQGGWIMLEEDIAGLTPQEIQNKFALPTIPKYICDVNLEAGTRLRIGEANPLFGFEGGGQQYDLIINGKNVGTFTNERIIGQ